MTTDTTGQSGGDQPIARTASQVADEASRTAEMQASNTLDRAADAADQVGQAVRQMSDSLRDQQPQVASFVQTAADRIDETSRYLREHEPRELIGAAESWARRQPALAIGGALIAGIAAGRFLRAAAPAGGNTSSFADGYGSGSGYGGRDGRYSGSSYGTTDAYDYGSTGVGASGYQTSPTSGYGAGTTTPMDGSDDMLIADVDVIPDSAVDQLTGDADTSTSRVGASVEGR